VEDPLERWADRDRWAVLGHCREPVCAETARRLACDAGIIPVLLGGSSEPLDIGRLTRVVPTGMRVLVCAFHHTMVHEGHWRLELDQHTWEVRVWRPDGRPHDLTSQPRGPTRLRHS
jgi:hypothetical protein